MEESPQIAQRKRRSHRRRGPRRGSLAYLLRRLDSDPVIRGRQFEKVCKWYLSNCRAEFRRVWLWAEWPERNGPDCGIDLVAERHTGEFVAVQAKADAPQHAIRKDEIDSFLSESSQERFAGRLLIATTDRIGSNARRVLHQQEKPVEFTGRSALGKETDAWPVSPKDLEAVRPKSVALRPHQLKALDAAEDSFEECDRTQLVMACGSGKTLVGIKARERFAAARTLVVIPSLPLMKQTIREWQSHSSKPFRRLAVCSDASVDDREDVVVGHPGELGVRVSTDPAVIAGFIEGDGDLVVFSTYQSSDQVAAACRGGASFDLVIADEAHWAAGLLDSPHAVILKDEELPAAKRLFLTATPKVIAEESRVEALDEGHAVASMDDESLFGPVAHRLSFGEAIQLGLLADYRVVICVVNDQDQLTRVRRRGLVTTGDSHITDAASLASQVVVLRAMRRFSLRRVLTFHSRVARAERFAGRLPAVAGWMGDEAPDGRLTARHVHGQMPALRREAVLKRFDELGAQESSVVSNVRCLAEGVDVPSIDAVAIIDPKRSRPEIVQAVGRALRTDGREGKVATVIVPAFVPAGADLTEALLTSVFGPVWEVLAALRDQDERFADEVDALRFELGSASRLDANFERLHLDIPDQVGPEFVSAFNAKLVREIGLTPQTQVRLGKVSPPAVRRDSEVTGRRVDRSLDQLGLEALARFVSRTGHSKVPVGHREEGFGLGDWFEGTLEAIETYSYGDPGRYFEIGPFESFMGSVRAVDLDAERFRGLVTALDPMKTLPRFWDLVASGKFPAELQQDRSVSTDDFPVGQVFDPYEDDEDWPETKGYIKYEGEWSYWKSGYKYLLDQIRPSGLQKKFKAAMLALDVLREAEALSEEIDSACRAHFRLGVVEGIEEIAREGCLIDQVEQRFRRNQERIAAYVQGWDFGKTRRQESAVTGSRSNSWGPS